MNTAEKWVTTIDALVAAIAAILDKRCLLGELRSGAVGPCAENRTGKWRGLTHKRGAQR